MRGAHACVKGPAYPLRTRLSGDTTSSRFVIELDVELQAVLTKHSRHGSAGAPWTVALAHVEPIPWRTSRPKPPRPSGDWLTVGEAAAAIGCHPKSINVWIRHGWVAVRKGGNPAKPWFFLQRSEVDRIKRSTPGSPSPAMDAP